MKKKVIPIIIAAFLVVLIAWAVIQANHNNQEQEQQSINNQVAYNMQSEAESNAAATQQNSSSAIQTYGNKWFLVHQNNFIEVLNVHNKLIAKTGPVTSLKFDGWTGSQNQQNLMEFDLYFKNFPQSRLTIGAAMTFDDKSLKNVSAGASLNLFDSMLTTYGLNDPLVAAMGQDDLSGMFGFTNPNAIELEKEAILQIK